MELLAYAAGARGGVLKSRSFLRAWHLRGRWPPSDPSLVLLNEGAFFFLTGIQRFPRALRRSPRFMGPCCLAADHTSGTFKGKTETAKRVRSCFFFFKTESAARERGGGGGGGVTLSAVKRRQGVRGFPFLAPPVASSAFSLLGSSHKERDSDPAAIKHGRHLLRRGRVFNAARQGSRTKECVQDTQGERVITNIYIFIVTVVD